MSRGILVPVRTPRREAFERPEAFTAADRVLLLAPHPDDESLAGAGMLQHAHRAGAALRVLYATDGENNPWAQLVHEWRWPVSAAARRRWAGRRRGEAIDALSRLGLASEVARFLGLPDQGLTGLLEDDHGTLPHTLRAELREWNPTVVAAPSLNDCHPDHSALAVALRIALAPLAERGRAPRVLHYVVHPSARREPGRWRLRLDEAERERKRNAILCHASQLRWRRSELLATARDVEEFEKDADALAYDATHPIARAQFEDDDLVFELASVPRLALGPLVLQLLAETREGTLVRATLPFRSRRELAVPLATSGGLPCGEARLAYEAAYGRGVLRFSPALLARQVFLKLERPFERRIGVFDEAGWREVPVTATT